MRKRIRSNAKINMTERIHVVGSRNPIAKTVAFEDEEVAREYDEYLPSSSSDVIEIPLLEEIPIDESGMTVPDSTIKKLEELEDHWGHD